MQGVVSQLVAMRGLEFALTESPMNLRTVSDRAFARDGEKPYPRREHIEHMLQVVDMCPEGRYHGICYVAIAARSLGGHEPASVELIRRSNEGQAECCQKS